MKKFLFGFVLALFAHETFGGEQKFSSLPIGNNLDGFIQSVAVWFGVEGNPIDDAFRYNRRVDGPLEPFIISKIREMAKRFTPKSGKENEKPGWALDIISDGIGGLFPYYIGESGPKTIATAYSYSSSVPLTYHNGKWEVREDASGEVKFDFPWGIPYYIPGVKDLEVNLYNGSRVSRFSTREGISDADNPCRLPATIDLFRMNIVAISTEISLAEPSWWSYAEITLLTTNESVTFMINRTERDGEPIRWSDPPPKFFVPPPIGITSIKRVEDDITEISVDRAGAGMVLEYSNDAVHWYPTQDTSVSLQSEGHMVLRHKFVSPQGFYRLRASSGVK